MKFSKFFSTLQESPWYREFLNPVLNEIKPNTRLLDIGTGSGKMLEILSLEKNVKSTGTDTSEDMLKEARLKLKNTDVELQLIKEGEKISFNDETFDYITICSVLFHMKKEDIDSLLTDALRTLKPDGEIIILTPTGSGGTLKLTRHFFSAKNKGIYVWYKSTKKRAMKWSKENYLKEFALKTHLTFQRTKVMHDFAHLEILTKKNK